MAASPRKIGADEGGTQGILLRELEAYGLTRNEAKVLLCLLQVGSARAGELAGLCKVARTNAYQLLDGLYARSLIERVPGNGPTVWVSPGRENVMERLFDAREQQLAVVEAEHQERLGELRARMEHVSELLGHTVEDNSSPALPFVHPLATAAQTKRAYDRLLTEATDEVLVLVRPPYSWAAGSVNPTILDALKRGVRVRGLYQAAQLEDPEQDAFRQDLEVYMDAGVEARVIDEPPLKIVLVDRRSALLAMFGPSGAVDGYPTQLLIDDPGFAAFQAEAFESLWATAPPYGERRTPAAARGRRRRATAPPRQGRR